MRRSATDQKPVTCKLCRHRWVPQGNGLPLRCANPHCRSERWNVGRARDSRAEQLKRGQTRKMLSRVEANTRLPVLGRINGAKGYSVLPVTVSWVQPPKDVEFKAGDYCLLLESLPKGPDVITEATAAGMPEQNLALFRPGVGYLGYLAHIEARGQNGQNTVYFAKVTLTESGQEVLIEPHLLKLPADQLEVRGVFQQSFAALVTSE